SRRAWILHAESQGGAALLPERHTELGSELLGRGDPLLGPNLKARAERALEALRDSGNGLGDGRVLAVDGRLPRDQVPDRRSEAVHVAPRRRRVTCEHLRRPEARPPARGRVGPAVFAQPHGQSKVDENAAVGPADDVRRLEVRVHDLLRMDVRERLTRLTSPLEHLDDRKTGLATIPEGA